MKNKTARRDELRRRIQDARRQSKHYCYGPELKRDIVAYTTECKAEGTSIRAVARELGLSTQVLPQWVRLAKLQLDAGKIPFEHNRTPKAMRFKIPSTPDSEESTPDSEE